jgi:hypothetical protein
VLETGSENRSAGEFKKGHCCGINLVKNKKDSLLADFYSIFE